MIPITARSLQLGNDLGHLGGEDLGQQNQVLMGAIRKLALAGEQAGFSVEDMIELLQTGCVSVETLLDLLRCRPELSQPHIPLSTSESRYPRTRRIGD